MLVLGQSPLWVVLGTVATTQAADFDFSAITTVTVTGPTAWAYSDTINVTWSTNVDPENVDISYCQGSQCTIENWTLTPIALAESNDGSYSWDTNSLPNGTGYKIVIARAWFQSPLGLSAAFEIYNADYDEQERRDILGIGFPDPSPIWTNTSTNLTTYMTDTISRSGVTWTQEDGAGTLNFSSTDTNTTTVSADQDGGYVIRFTATDYAGNTVYDEIIFNRDTTGPTASDDVSAGWYDGSANITFTCDDGTGTGCNRIRYALNSIPTPWSSDSVSIEGWQGSVWISNIGTHTLWYIAEDNLGNLSTAQSGENLLRIEYDYDDPEYWDYVDIYDDEYRKNQFQKSASVDVPTGVLSGAWSMISGPWLILFSDASANPTNIEADTEWEYVIEYEVTTNGLNTYSDTFTLIWDQTDPTSSDNAPVGRENVPVTVDFTCDDTLWAVDYSDCERMYYNINNGWWNYIDIDEEDFDLYFDTDGTYNVEYYAVDRASNSEEDEVNNSFMLYIDQTDPSASIQKGSWMGEGDDETLYSNDGTETVSAIVTDNLSGIESCAWSVENAQYGTTGDVLIDTGESDGCASVDVTAGEPGIYTIRLTVMDRAGNSDYDEFVLYYDDSIPVVENLNVTVESYNTIDVAWLAYNSNGFSPIDAIQYYIDLGGENPIGYLNLSEEGATETNFEWDIDVSNLSNGTYTIYVRAITQSEISSDRVSQSFNKVSSPAETTGPTFVSSTPSNAATYVSVASGTATITFDEAIDYACWYGECYSVDIKKVSDNSSVVSGEDPVTWSGNTVSINYGQLEYNTNYVISIPATSIMDTDDNRNEVETLIYFSTQVGTAPDITSLSIESVWATDAYIVYTTDPETPDSREYRVSTTAYSGTWTSSDGSRQYITDLTPNTTYYYQVRFVNNGHTVVSVPMSFKTASDDSGIIVHSISRILNGNDVLANNNYDNGYHFRFYITINDLYEHLLEFKLNNWSQSDGDTMAVANNTTVVVSEAGTSDYGYGTTLTDTNYTTVDSNVGDIDADQTLGGRQLYLDLFYKIPSGSAGVYSTSYGIKATNHCLWAGAWDGLFLGWDNRTLAC